MSSPAIDARIIEAPKEQIAALAVLYDKFAHAIDPCSKEADEAEAAFFQSVSNWHDYITEQKPSLHEFTKGVIRRCKQHLKATAKKGDFVSRQTVI